MMGSYEVTADEANAVDRALSALYNVYRRNGQPEELGELYEELRDMSGRLKVTLPSLDELPAAHVWDGMAEGGACRVCHWSEDAPGHVIT